MAPSDLPRDTGFIQEPPELKNQYAEDRALQRLLERTVPEAVLAEMSPALERMGQLAAGDLHRLSVQHRLDEPRYVPWDAWGNRVDQIEVNPAWEECARVAAREGLVATGYERKLGSSGEYSRTQQFALVYLFAPSSQTYTCPLAMTDGAARTLETIGSDELKRDVLSHLTSRDPEAAWTSGQWMTERTGGSDVGRSETVARQDGQLWRLYGTKWFTSAVTSEVTLTLARPEGNGPGGKGLALFFLRLRDGDGRLNGIVVNRMKEKLGTKHLPTAELTLDGAIAEPVKGLQNGIRNMASMLNITRTWNAVCAIAGMRRGIALARDYAHRRIAFGAPLSEKPLHLDTLATLAAEHEAALQLVFHEVLLLGRSETTGVSDEEAALLRALQPITKLTTGRQAVATASEVLECFGGAGYVEDTGLPQLLRDAQVLSIWEGTTNVLSLESCRALQRENGWEPFVAAVKKHAQAAKDSELARLGQVAITSVEQAMAWVAATGPNDPPRFEAGARRFAMTLGRSFALALLVEHAQWELEHGGDRRSLAAARRFARNGVNLIAAFDGEADLELDRALALG